jgi:hypothetical protein
VTAVEVLFSCSAFLEIQLLGLTIFYAVLSHEMVQLACWRDLGLGYELKVTLL